MKSNVIPIPRPVRLGEQDPNEPAPEPGKFVVTLRRPDGRVTYMQVDNEHFDRVHALTQGEFRDASIVAINPGK